MTIFSGFNLDESIHGRISFDKEGIYHAKLMEVKYFNNEEKRTFGIQWLFKGLDENKVESEYLFTQSLADKNEKQINHAMGVAAHICLTLKEDQKGFLEAVSKATDTNNLVERLNSFLKDIIGQKSFYIKISRSTYQNKYRYGFNQVNKPFISLDKNRLKLSAADMEVLDTTSVPGAGYTPPSTPPNNGAEDDLPF